MKNQKLDKRPKTELRHRAFFLSIEIIKFLENLDYKPAIKIISDQLIRSATSIGANLVEAKGSSSKKEFLNFFQISLKSTHETKYWLAMLREILQKQRAEINKFIQETEEIEKILSSSILTMKGKKKL